MQGKQHMWMLGCFKKAESDFENWIKWGNIRQSFNKVICVKEQALVGVLNVSIGYIKSRLFTQ